MRITHVCRSGWPVVGGLESAVAGLAEAQARRGHDVRVVTLNRGPSGESLHSAVRGGVRWVRVPRVGPPRYPWARGLRRALGEPQLVHVHGLGGLVDQLARLELPVGVSTHGGFGHTPRFRLLKAAWVRTGLRHTFAEVDAVWFTSDADREQLAPAGRDGPVLPNGVDLERWAAIERTPRPGRWVVVGRVDEHKGLDDLVDALAGMVDPPQVRIIGPHPRPELVVELRERIRARGLAARVTLEGALSEVALRRALGEAELAVFPSRAEGFGLAVTEAMAAEVPVVVSPIGAHLEQVIDGVTGYVVGFRGRGAAAELTAVRGHDHRAVARRGQRAAARFGWPRVTEAFERAYERMLGS